jgi:hypothetical protein
MNIEHMGGSVDVADLAGLEPVLKERFGDGLNEYWLSFEGEEFPALAVLVRDELACVHYFPADGHPGFVALPRGEVAGVAGSVAFETNGAEVHAPRHLIVSFSDARHAVESFLTSRARDPHMNWVEL